MLHLRFFAKHNHYQLTCHAATPISRLPSNLREKDYLPLGCDSSKHSEEPSFHRKSSLEDNRSLYGKRKYNILKKANILYCETTEVVMRRMLMIVEEEIFKADSQNIQIRGIKNRLDEAFGPNWNCFMARSGCWALKTYKPGTNLVFEYEGMMYDIFQAVDSTQNVHTKGSTGYLVYS
ncbi:expressed protein [Echinococcus multilocularis]|uniref:Expressed protein n=1 Tax=Echinococcus multilocularis TaxID=6211 RepID=A0A068YG38_ECHMU|nr:expressed protein [Echinococcus multilocularis]